MALHPECEAGLDHNLHIPRAERVLLWAVRTWVIGRSQGVALDSEIDTALARIHAHGAAGPHLDLMAALEDGATRKLSVECVCCRHATPDEQRIVDVVAMFQQGRDFEATRLLRGFVTPPGSLVARASAIRLAEVFEERGLVFVPRPAAMVDRATAFASRATEWSRSTTLH